MGMHGTRTMIVDSHKIQRRLVDVAIAAPVAPIMLGVDRDSLHAFHNTVAINGSLFPKLVTDGNDNGEA